MSQATWALFDASGRLVGQPVTGGAAPSFAEAGFARAVRTARQADLTIETIDPVTGAIAEVPALVEARLIPLLKAEGERRKMLSASAGGYKKAEYAAKRNEVIAWDALGASPAAILAAFEQLPLGTRLITFEYAIADARAFGDQPADAIARFRRGIAAASAASRLAAVEARACAAIRAAPTAAAKRAAFAAINWS